MRKAGFKHSLETIEKIRLSNLGKIRTAETRLRNSIAKRGENHKNWGQSLSEQTRKRIGDANRGKQHPPMSEVTKQKLREASLRNGNRPPIKYGTDNHFFGKSRKGKDNPRWISDRSKLQRYNDDSKDRRSSTYNAWRKQVWLRDDFTCKIANPDCEGRIEAHHILGWSEHPELRYEVKNGITLCHAHHPRVRAEEKRLIPTFLGLVSVSKEIF